MDGELVREFPLALSAEVCAGLSAYASSAPAPSARPL